MGAGASAHAKFPTRPELLAKFEKRFSERGQWRDGEREFVERERDPLWRAEEYRWRLPEADFNAIVQKTFAPPRRLVIDDFCRALMKLPFSHVLTTNYDELLERLHRRLRRREQYKVLAWEESEKLTRFITSLGDAKTARCYVHLHGRLKKPQHRDAAAN